MKTSASVVVFLHRYFEGTPSIMHLICSKSLLKAVYGLSSVAIGPYVLCDSMRWTKYCCVNHPWRCYLEVTLDSFGVLCTLWYDPSLVKSGGQTLYVCLNLCDADVTITLSFNFFFSYYLPAVIQLRSAERKADKRYITWETMKV